MTNPIAASNPAQNAASQPAAAAGASSAALGSQQVFLQLLVAQMKNQDPLNPADSTTYVTQLAQFSSLEQLIAIKDSVDTITTAVAGSGTGNSTSASDAAAAATETNQGAKAVP